LTTTLPLKMFRPFVFDSSVNAASLGILLSPSVCTLRVKPNSARLPNPSSNAEGVKVADHLGRIHNVVTHGRMGKHLALCGFDQLSGGRDEPARLPFKRKVLCSKTAGSQQSDCKERTQEEPGGS
jgi:hypothetical protein